MAKIIFEKNIEIPMRDGCVLRGDLFRPDTSEKLPVIINRTPYNKAMPMVFALTMDSLRAASAGYNVLIEDCRGRFASDGVFNCFTDEARDGYDTVEWAARQPWSNGNVGMYGASYMGATQWLAATQAPPRGERRASASWPPGIADRGQASIAVRRRSRWRSRIPSPAGAP